MGVIFMSRSDARARWSSILAEQQSSDLSVAAWCRERNIDKASFYEWRKRLKSSSGSDGSVQFVRVALGRDVSPSRFSVCIGRASVLVEPGFDRRLLSELLDVLEARTC